MKKLILTTTFLAAGILGVLAQGTVDFSNLSSKFTDGVDRNIYLNTVGGPLAPVGTVVSLYTGTDLDGTANTVIPGVFIGGTKSLQGIGNAQAVNLTIEAVYTDTASGDVYTGSITFPYTTPSPGDPPSASLMTGMTAFALVVPEPSTIALGVLGLGALLLFRRRKN